MQLPPALWDLCHLCSVPQVSQQRISWGKGDFVLASEDSRAGWLGSLGALLQPGWRESPKGQSSGGCPRKEEKELRPRGCEGGTGAT